MPKHLIAYLLIMNALGFASMLADKRRAQKKRWRIPERTLLAIAFLGGSLGGLLGMCIFRHKTKHPRFTTEVPMMLVIHGAILYFLFVR